MCMGTSCSINIKTFLIDVGIAECRSIAASMAQELVVDNVSNRFY